MKKKSVKKACARFVSDISEIRTFVANGGSLSEKDASWMHDYAIIRLYRAFEKFVLTCLVCAINNDSAQISSVTKIDFPKHLSDEVCEYLVVGDGYFDFKGRDGLIKTVKKFVVDGHYLLAAVKEAKYKDALERLSALRNFAAHDSPPSKKRALEAAGADRMGSAGSWLKTQGRFGDLCAKLEALSIQIEAAAPY